MPATLHDTPVIDDELTFYYERHAKWNEMEQITSLPALRARAFHGEMAARIHLATIEEQRRTIARYEAERKATPDRRALQQAIADRDAEIARLKESLNHAVNAWWRCQQEIRSVQQLVAHTHRLIALLPADARQHLPSPVIA